MKNIITLIFLTAILLGGCKKSVFDINSNPNSPTEGSITPELLLPRAQHNMAARMATSYGDFGGWMGYWARSGTYGPSTEEESYNITTTFGATNWSSSTGFSWYNILYDLHLTEQKAAEQNKTAFVAVAKILKTIGFMYLVDCYNNVPYSKAFQLSSNILPPYDNGEDIYADLLVQLDSADLILQSALESDNIGFTASDVVYGTSSVGPTTFANQVASWRKFGNSQRLKLIIHESVFLGDAACRSEVAKIVANGAGFIDAGESANVQPTYAVDDGKQNPFWNSYKTLYTGVAANDYWRANNYVLSYFRTINDIRYQYFFSAAATPINGETYFGYNYGEVVNDPDQPKAANSSNVSGPGLAISATQPQWLFTSVESMFLQAIAVQSGWIAGSGKTAYEAAVTESFNWLKVDDATTTATNYLAQELPQVNYDLAPNKLNLILMQKYLSLVGVNNFEAWTDYRRTGIPSDVPLSLSPSRGNRVIPKRLRYPQDEYNYNAAEVAKQGTIDPQTSTIFWSR